ncbi:hypothetical protein M436DRAFT_82072 [Aureobasidium namibiae CBS 147.97]|uniref:Uncharacterized protein n=1 Tax=Aureobasidium namibiae CBS 147.97 TaxID=1043004 RepID=A0A074WIA2_9PEZI|nr:uncharacterized protein M436DRAFT_82072 [Aureobasidium namibiae CBS 147.97]KEQ72793.1 hypothetical protein M436DRAFT_82072 [Aureobasidium namibiae CBS 147.97]
MNSTMMANPTLPSDLTPCLVRQVFFALFHRIAVFYLIFSIIDCIVDRILRLRCVRKRIWILYPTVWVWYLKLWSLYLVVWYWYARLWGCQSKHWIHGEMREVKKSSKRLILQSKKSSKKWSRKVIETVAMVGGFVAEALGDFVREKMDDIRAVRVLAVHAPTTIKERKERMVVYAAEFFKDLAESLRDLHNAGLITEEDEVEQETKKEVMTKMARKEHLHSTDARRSDRVNGRTYASVAATYLKTDLENDSNRNWSNEHGNLSPGASPHRSSRLYYPSPGPSPSHRNSPGSPRSVQVSHPSPRDPPGSGTGSGVSSSNSSSAVYIPSSTASASSGYNIVMHTPSSTTSSSRRAIYTPSSTTSSGTTVNYTPGASGNGIGGTGTGDYDSSHMGAYSKSGSLSILYTPCTDTDAGEMSVGTHTPSASESSASKTRTPPSTNNTDSEDESFPGTPTSTSSSGPDSTVIYTPPRIDGLDNEDAVALGTPDSASSSSSASTSDATPSP